MISAAYRFSVILAAPDSPASIRTSGPGRVRTAKHAAGKTGSQVRNEMTSRDSAPADASETSRTEPWLRECLYMMEPMARMMVANGVTYSMFTQSLKRVFLEAAEQELAAHGRKITDSALSLLSGVHRKNVRTLTVQRHQPLSRATSIATEVVARWLSDSAYVDAYGKPRVLSVRARPGESPELPTFERLAQSVSKDFHARSVLVELVRLGVAELDGDDVRLALDKLSGSRNVHDTLRIMATNVRDHLAAACANLLAAQSNTRPPFLEYAMWATELSEASVRELAVSTKNTWFSAMNKSAQLATALEEQDRNAPKSATCRFRFGAYVFHEKGVPDSDPGASADGADKDS
jgi:hypothetical protein